MSWKTILQGIRRLVFDPSSGINLPNVFGESYSSFLSFLFTQKMRRMTGRTVIQVHDLVFLVDNVLHSYYNITPELWPNQNSRTNLLRKSVYHIVGTGR